MNKCNPILNPKQSSFIANDAFLHSDERRNIFGVTGSLPGDLKQIKLIEFNSDALPYKRVVGNHGHTEESRQWEYVVVLGDPEKFYIEFATRDLLGKVELRNLKGGECVLIPPGASLALSPLCASAKVLEISNMIHDPQNYFKDALL
jgi:hypothetical protein